jgi:transposase
VLLASGISAQSLALMQTLVVGRLVDAGSERHTWFWAENRSAIYELTARPVRCSLNSFYRAADALFKCKEALEVHLSKKEKELFSLPESMCFLDLTNTYLEGEALKNPKAKRGHSKERRSDCKLLTLALIIDEQGFAKYSHLYAGNQNESKSLKEMVASLVTIRPDLSKHRTVILDAGVATEENVQYLKENHFHYIVVNRSKGAFNAEDTDKMEVIYTDDDQQFKVEVSRQHKDGEAWLLCRSTGRQQKERGIRTRQENLFIERLKYYRNGLNKKGHTKVYAKVIEMIGRLREKYPRASKHYEIIVIPDDDTIRKSTTAKDIIWKKRSESAGKFDGCFVLRTDRFDMSAEQIWKTYVMLTRVEKAFRCLKSSLGLRPVFHQVQQRADSHMFISVLAYHILHIIEHRLRMHGDHRSWETIRDILSTHQRLTIEYNVKEQDKIVRYHLRLCSMPEPEHRVIYHRLGLSGLPLDRTYIAIK